jgi:hypothetical protein
MKYIKRFESRKDEILRGKDREQIEEDIKGILIELSDIGITHKISWIGNWTNGIMMYFFMEKKRNHDIFNTSDIKEYLLTIEDYLREYWGNISVRYEESNYIINYYKDVNILSDDQEVTKVELEIKRN